MSEGNSTHTLIRSFLVQKFPAAKKRAITNDTPLLESGIVDSLGMLDVVAFLEKSFMLTLSDDDLTAEHFGSIDSLVSFVEKKKTEIEVPVE